MKETYERKASHRIRVRSFKYRNGSIYRNGHSSECGIEYFECILYAQRSFKSSEHINEKGNGPYRGFGFLSIFSDPIDLVHRDPSDSKSNSFSYVITYNCL